MKMTGSPLGRLHQRCQPVHTFIASGLLCFWLVSPAAVGFLHGQEATHYLTAGQPDAAALLPPPPRPGSDEASADLAQVAAVQRACTTNQAAIAFSEKKFSIFNFTPAIGEFFQEGKLPKTELFFSRVQKEAAAVTDDAKILFKRPRPYTVDPSLASGKLEKSFSYPSGHSTEAMVLALLLADLFPDKAEAILTVGSDIGWHRVWIARHYPTDIYAGRVFARAIVRELKSSPDFRRDFAEVQTEIAEARRTKEHQAAAPGS
jgi:acid phosphatase (class A)